MKGRYYVMNGFYVGGKFDESRIDALMPKDFRGNAVEKLISQHGYKLTEDGTLYTPDNRKFCRLVESN